MGKVAGRQKRRYTSRSKKHADPLKGVNVSEQNVELIVRKVHPSQMTKAPFHLENSPFRRKDLKT